MRRKLPWGEKITYGDPEENSSHNFMRRLKATIHTALQGVPPLEVDPDNTFL
jgi:hypothetical protein